MKLFNLSRFIFYVIPSFHLFLHRYEWIENSTRVRVNHELPIPYQQRAQRKNTEWMNRPRRQTFNHQHKCRKISNTSLCIQRVGGKNIIASFWANFKWEKWILYLILARFLIKIKNNNKAYIRLCHSLNSKQWDTYSVSRRRHEWTRMKSIGKLACIETSFRFYFMNEFPSPLFCADFMNGGDVNRTESFSMLFNNFKFATDDNFGRKMS